MELESTLLTIPDFENIPDLEGDAETMNLVGALGISSIGHATNRDYYREYVCYLVQRELFKPIRFWLKNEGAIGARDVYIDIAVASENVPISIQSISSLPTSEPAKTRILWTPANFPNKPSEILASFSGSWETNLEIPALQPKREMIPPKNLVIAAEFSTKIMLTARIFADSLPEPVTSKLSISMTVKKVELKAGEIMKTLSILEKKS